jgi:hypothetical protein
MTGRMAGSSGETIDGIGMKEGDEGSCESLRWISLWVGTLKHNRILTGG